MIHSHQQKHQLKVLPTTGDLHVFFYYAYIKSQVLVVGLGGVAAGTKQGLFWQKKSRVGGVGGGGEQYLLLKGIEGSGLR